MIECPRCHSLLSIDFLRCPNCHQELTATQWQRQRTAAKRWERWQAPILLAIFAFALAMLAGSALLAFFLFRQMWRENGWVLIPVVAIAVLMLYGHRQTFTERLDFRAYQERQLRRNKSCPLAPVSPEECEKL